MQQDVLGSSHDFDSCDLLQVLHPCHASVASSGSVVPTIPEELFACLSDLESDTYRARNSKDAVCAYRYPGPQGQLSADLEGRASVLLTRLMRNYNDCVRSAFPTDASEHRL